MHEVQSNASLVNQKSVSVAISEDKSLILQCNWNVSAANHSDLVERLQKYFQNLDLSHCTNDLLLSL